MCEPTHSIVQWNDPNDPDDDVGGLSAQAGQYPKRMLTGKLVKWARKIGKWMHMSRLGRGHSEAIGERSGVAGYHFDEVFKLYEAEWWHRQVKPDLHFPSAELLDCATQYAHTSSIGSLTQLRNFLEVSLRNTERRSGYLQRLRNDMLTEKGRHEFDTKCSKYFRIKKDRLMIHKLSSANIDKLVNFTLGFTRKRELLVPEWADDDALWTPKQPAIITSST